VEQEQMTKKINMEISTIKKEFDTTKGKVIDFILESVLDVDLNIPDVVKGHFYKKLGESK
jgi:hypothetical protein